jgi:hypothetical protein
MHFSTNQQIKIPRPLLQYTLTHKYGIYEVSPNGCA